MSNAQVYFMIGNVGAGKSTWANALAQSEKAHVFCVDEWMKTLYWEDQPTPMTYEWALERTERVEAQTLKETVSLLQLGVSVILELGFFTKVQRDRVRNHLQENGFDPVYCYLDVDSETRWARVSQRNQEQGETYKFEVDRDIFEFCEKLFEPLTPDEIDTSRLKTPSDYS